MKISDKMPPAVTVLTPEELAREGAIPFRFETSWTFLTRDLTVLPPEFTPRLSEAGKSSQAVSTSRVPIPLKVRSGPRAIAPKVESQREWELVLPRMTRPPAAAAGREPAMPVPHFGMGEESAWTRLINRLPMWGRVAAAVLVLSASIGFGWMMLSSPAASESSGGSQMGESGWVTDWASDAAGSRRGRQITLYRPSIGLANYRMEFVGRIEQKSLGWVFRAVDTRNYHVMKLEVVRQGAFPAVMLTRFPVIQGIEGTRVERMLPIMVRDDTAFSVRLDASGPRFAVSIQGQVVDVWTDDRLKTGGVGFLNEREERGKAHSIRIVFPQGSSKGS